MRPIVAVPWVSIAYRHTRRSSFPYSLYSLSGLLVYCGRLPAHGLLYYPWDSGQQPNVRGSPNLPPLSGRHMGACTQDPARRLAGLARPRVAPGVTKPQSGSEGVLQPRTWPSSIYVDFESAPLLADWPHVLPTTGNRTPDHVTGGCQGFPLGYPDQLTYI